MRQPGPENGLGPALPPAPRRATISEAALTVTTRKDIDPLCSHCLKVLGMAQSKMA